MSKIFISLVFAIIIIGCSAPKPPQISLTKNLKPINFTTINYDNTVIKSEQPKEPWRKQFVYSIDSTNHSPELFYALAHADKIIAKVKPPFINFVFAKVQENLRSYGVTTQIELLMIEEQQQKSQVVLDCIKYANKQ